MSVAIRIIARTVLFYGLVILGATFAMYTLLWAAPGDVRDVLCTKGCSESRKVEIAKEMGLVRTTERPGSITIKLLPRPKDSEVIRGLLTLSKGKWQSSDVSQEVISGNGIALIEKIRSPKVAEVLIRQQFMGDSLESQTWLLVQEESLFTQYRRWLTRALRFDFGRSVTFSQGAQISTLLRRAVALTSGLVFGAALLTLLFSFFMVWRPIQRWARWLARIGQYPLTLLSFVPLYILAYWLVMASGRLPHWLAQNGWLSQQTRMHWINIGLLPFGQELEWTAELGWLFLVPFFLSMLLLALGNNNLVEQASGVRAEHTQLTLQPFMRAVRARGASWPQHLMHNMLLPLTQFFTTRAILLLGTVVIIESIMGITGIGWLLWEATQRRDTPLVLAIALFATVISCLLQMLNEIALQLIDPRLRKDT